jgi:uncharacterized protein (DUF885 family)
VDETLIWKCSNVSLCQPANAEERLGGKFDVKDFHNQVLMDGPMPLSMLEDKIDDWMESRY